MFNVEDTVNRLTEPYKVVLEINKTPVTMEIDTGASVSIISEETFRDLGKLKLSESKAKLKTYTGEDMAILGTVEVHVDYESFSGNLHVIVVKGRGPNLLGRDWLKSLKLNWNEIFAVKSVDKDVDRLLEDYSEIFKDELGAVKGVTAKIYVNENEKPRYFKARPVPYALKGKIESELVRLEECGIIQPVQFSEWAAPIVPVVKDDGSIRICGDYKVTVNLVSKLDKYPIPKTEDLYAILGGGETYTKLDMNQAYNQLLLDEDSKKYVTINTHKGLFTYNRLPYGVSSSGGIFQRTIENLLQGIPNVLIRVDDILITGKTTVDHLKTLQEVFERLKNAGIRLKRRKCIFMAPEVVYLGHKINAKGVFPVKDKVEAIKNAPQPRNVSELKAFLGMLNYYHRFLPNLSTELYPLHELLRKNTKWRWGMKQKKAFQKAKEMLQSDKLLVHFEPNKEIILACDASPYGVGAVLSHKMKNGEEKPIAYASKTLTSAEKNYSQIEKESLAIIFGVKKFHQYIFGRHVTIVTDHKPLIGLFREDRSVPINAASRIQRWALTLEAYEYEIKYKEGRNHGNADGLSRLPLTVKDEKASIPGDTLLLLQHFDETSVTSSKIKR
ncbi:hypothetical protein FSP39_002564 [Pinctada imbricata]|uniref:RNA-directed DNA polymerase n=1 Tax=Pinctada imbricata TaxID=66713 RepID=A0AA88XKX0_PINIB|nr:hypothetical protein FSP39_002564 [Pinctada imbricata]